MKIEVLLPTHNVAGAVHQSLWFCLYRTTMSRDNQHLRSTYLDTRASIQLRYRYTQYNNRTAIIITIKIKITITIIM